MANHLRNESNGSTLQVDSALGTAENKSQRRSDRVFLTLPIRISGLGEQDKNFSEEGHTVDVSQNGATIVVDRELYVGQNIKVQRIGPNKEAVARVVCRKASQSEGHLFGIAFADERVNLWDIIYPTAVELEKAVLRTLLRCISCGQLEVSYLNEFESHLFLTHHSVARLCAQCGGWTIWTRPHGHLLTDPYHRAGVDNQNLKSRHVLATGSRDARSHGRIRVDTVACVRHPTLGSEAVLVGDLGPGGLSFYSASSYPQGERVEVAIPYTSKTPNIYLPARIVASRKGKEKSLVEYSAAYLA